MTPKQKQVLMLIRIALHRTVRRQRLDLMETFQWACNDVCTFVSYFGMFNANRRKVLLASSTNNTFGFGFYSLFSKWKLAKCYDVSFDWIECVIDSAIRQQFIVCDKNIYDFDICFHWFS